MFNYHRITKSSSKKIGHAPGSKIHIGKKEANSIIRRTVFEKDSFTTEVVEQIEYNEEDKQKFVWFDLDGIPAPEVVSQLIDKFQLNALLGEDLINTEERTKLEDFETNQAIFVKATHVNKNKLAVEQIGIVFHENYLITVSEKKEDDIFEFIYKRLINEKSRIATMGSNYLVYMILDNITDHYFLALEKVEDQLEELHAQILRNNNNPTGTVHHLKRELILLRKIIYPWREILNKILRKEIPFFKDDLTIYYQDIYDHILRLTDNIETLKDYLAGLHDLHFSNLNIRMNAIMKVLTIISTIFIPLTFLAGVYGMNFKYLPELGWKWSYPVLWIIMLLIVGFMLYQFKKKKWF